MHVASVVGYFFLQEKDVNRTVGINTDYVGTLDFGITDADRDFCVEVCMPLIKSV